VKTCNCSWSGCQAGNVRAFRPGSRHVALRKAQATSRKVTSGGGAIPLLTIGAGDLPPPPGVRRIGPGTTTHTSRTRLQSHAGDRVGRLQSPRARNTTMRTQLLFRTAVPGLAILLTAVVGCQKPSGGGGKSTPKVTVAAPTVKSVTDYE